MHSQNGPRRSMRQRMKTYPLTYEALYSGKPKPLAQISFCRASVWQRSGFGLGRRVALPHCLLPCCHATHLSVLPGDSCLLCGQLHYLLFPLCCRGPLVQPVDGAAQHHGGECSSMFRRRQADARFPRLACRGGCSPHLPAWGASCRSHARCLKDHLLLRLPLQTCSGRGPALHYQPALPCIERIRAAAVLLLSPE